MGHGGSLLREKEREREKVGGGSERHYNRGGRKQKFSI
jgi:hypothetical protein